MIIISIFSVIECVTIGVNYLHWPSKIGTYPSLLATSNGHKNAYKSVVSSGITCTIITWWVISPRLLKAVRVRNIEVDK
jgi:hypothetical protein